MNILHSIVSMSPKAGGVSQALRNLIPYLNKNGTGNEVVCFDSPGEEYGINDFFLIHKIGPSKTPYAYVKNYENWLSENLSRFDCVIIHGLWLYNSYSTYRIITKTCVDKPYFVMPHGMLDPYFQKAKGRKIKAIRNRILWQFLERKVTNNATGLLFTCQRELELARNTFNGYLPKKELVVSMGVIPPPAYNFSMARAFLDITQLEKEDSYWLFLSRIDPKKGIDILLNIYIKLQSQGIILPKLIIAGPTDNAYAQSLINMYEKKKGIIFIGMLQGQEKWGAIYGASLFILPSHQENFGIAVVEALACGIPVAISDQVNIYTEIESGNAGFIYPDTEKGLEESLLKILNKDKKDLDQMRENAIQTYQKNYDPISAAKQFIHQINLNVISK